MNVLKTFQTLVSGATAGVALFAASMSFADDADVLPTTDDNVETFWSAKYWTIFQNNTRQSCFIEWRSEDSVVQAGLTKVQDAFYLGAFVKEFETTEGEHDIAISLNGNIYVGSSKSVTRTLSDGFKGGYIVFDNPQFLADLVEAREFVAFQGTPYIVTISLKTPQNAIDRARDCMAGF